MVSQQKIELSERCTVVDRSGIYFKGINSNGVDYLTAAFIGADIASIELPEHVHALSAAAQWADCSRKLSAALASEPILV